MSAARCTCCQGRCTCGGRRVTLGLPLAVFSDTTLCDHADHEARLITDGTRALAYTVVAGYDLTVTREHTTLTASCNATHRDEEWCPGTYTWDLATPAWTGDRETVDLLSSYGAPVETTDAHDAAVQG